MFLVTVWGEGRQSTAYGVGGARELIFVATESCGKGCSHQGRLLMKERARRALV